MEKITAEAAFEMIYNRLDFLDRNSYSEEAEIVREALASERKFKEWARARYAANEIASL